jgi:hypothetical protein
MSATPASAGTWQSPEDQPTPFWRRVPKFFLLPLEKPVLVRIATLSALTIAAPLLLALGFLGFLLLCLLLLAVLVYGAQFGFRIIEQSSRGFLYPSEYPLQVEGSGIGRPFKYVAVNVVFLLVVAIVAVLSRGSEFLIWAAWFVLFVVALPAAVMRLVISGSLFSALQPAGMVQVIARIGKPYIALVVFIFFAQLCQTYGMALLAGAGGVTAALVGAAAGGPRSSVGAGMVAVFFFMSVGFWYFTYMICALIGYAMYQYADALDITVVGPGERRHGGRVGTVKVDVAKRTRDALIARMVAAGEIKEAIDLINDDLRLKPNDLSLHARLHKLLLAEGYGPRIDSHTERYLDLLMKSDNAREALPLVEAAFKRNPNWEPRELGHVVPLGRAALAADRPQLAAQLIRGFDRKHRMHPDIPHVYLLGAQIMVQTGGASEQARGLLQTLVSRFPGHPAGAEAKRYLERLDRIGSRPGTVARPATTGTPGRA